ncbi:MAG TPA: VTT domain-containing protein [Bryobacteraceae bacterium]|jgi:membrane protein YqaA with SNARE-associated domain|nr:VTT domain-containing protein [Bryobacteraceae bacterium]
MHELLRSLAHFFFSLGGWGLLLLGVLDSSFLFMPLGNDLLVIALTANHHSRILYYVAMATAGSVAGVAVTDWASRKGGQKGEEAIGKGRQVRYVEDKVKKNGALALVLASLMPPPFPFTPFIIVAAALQYPRKKLLSIVAVCRALRFGLEGGLALIFGRRIIELGSLPAVQWFVIAVVTISLVGSGYSIWKWIRKSRTARA